MHIRHFLMSCLSFVGLAFAALGVPPSVDRAISTAFLRLGDLWRRAFPVCPAELEARRHKARALAEFKQRQRDEAFAAFMEQSRSHETFSGSGFHLDTIARVF